MKKLFAFILLTLFSSAQAFTPFVAQDIRVDGLQRISDGTVFSYLPMEAGDEITARIVQDSINALYKTGFFDEIEISQEDNILVITVRERSAISDIDIAGNRDIKTEDLMKALDQIGLSEGEVFNRMQLERVEGELIRQYYSRGKYNVDLDTSIKELPRNRVKVTIVISEGKAAKIKHLNIVGNTSFETQDLLDEFKSDTSNWTSWYSSDDQYSKEKISGDLEKLRSFYQDRGYIDFDIESTQVTISPDKKDIYITANVREGEIFNVSDIELSGDLILKEEELRPLLLLRDGDVFSRKRLEVSAKNITAVLSNLGYAFSDVVQIPEINRENNTVKLKLVVNPGKRVLVRRIIFQGNANTRDEILRREMRQFEGAWFSQRAIDRSKIRLQRLGYFTEVNVETPQVPGSDDQVDIIVSVEEANAGSFQFGVGYSQTLGASFNVSLSQRNFLGSGKEVGINLNNSSYYSQFSLSYTNPYFTDSGVSLGYILSYKETDQGELNITNYTTDTKLAGVTASVPLTETDRVRLGLTFENTVVYATRGFTSGSIVDYLCQLSGIPLESDPDVDDCTDDITTVEGEFDTIRMDLGWARDSRNHFFKPTRGTYQRLGAEIALPGSTVEYYKMDYQNRTYFPIGKSLSIMAGARLGYGDTYGEGDEDLFPFFEHFYAGGVRSVRGFQDNTLGPRDENNDPIGGAFLAMANVEMALPLPFLKDQSTTRLSWFLDAGNVFTSADDFDASEIRYSSGLSIRWQAPVGPIEISFGIPLNDQAEDYTENLQFSFGNL